MKLLLFNSLNEQHIRKILLIVSIILFAYIFIVNAWICDDAYITFRVADNFIHGYGLTWNPEERVQVSTHPLWMLLISFFYYITSDVFYTTILLSLILCFASILIVFYMLRNYPFWTPTLLILLLISSKAFIDFTSSGLENPLLYFWVALFCYFIFSKERHLYELSQIEIIYLLLIISLSFITRQDIVLLFLPAIVYILIQNAKTAHYRLLPSLCIGMLPALFWLIFSLIYYGFLFPNSAYAKLNTGISKILLMRCGIQYYLYTLNFDAITLVIILSALVILILKKQALYRMIACGIVLYLFYIIWIGGDFFGGRFFSVPFFFSCCLLVKIIDNRRFAVIFFLLAFISIITSPKSPIKSTINYTGHPIFDQRAFYYPYTGLLNYVTYQGLKHPWYINGLKFRDKKEKVAIFPAIGMFGFAAGPKKYIIDNFALGDPLLAQLPVKNKTSFWIGHFEREIPDGYRNSVEFSKNLIADPNLKLFYDRILNITRGPLFSFPRWIDIFKINTGRDNDLTNEYIWHLQQSLSMKQWTGGWPLHPGKPYWIDLPWQNVTIDKLTRILHNYDWFMFEDWFKKKFHVNSGAMFFSSQTFEYYRNIIYQSLHENKLDIIPWTGSRKQQTGGWPIHPGKPCWTTLHWQNVTIDALQHMLHNYDWFMFEDWFKKKFNVAPGAMFVSSQAFEYYRNIIFQSLQELQGNRLDCISAIGQINQK